MRTILSLFVVLIFVAGCGGGDGGDLETDCSDPTLTHTEPLPSGEHPEFLITRGDDYWSCEGETNDYNPDGTFTGTIDHEEIAEAAEAVWEACEVGTRPPDVAGHWVVSHGRLCLRLDTYPGIVTCSTVVSGREIQQELGLYDTILDLPHDVFRDIIHSQYAIEARPSLVYQYGEVINSVPREERAYCRREQR